MTGTAMTTAEELAMIRAVLAAPTDAVPRLMYADWLSEHGQPRSEYVRLMVENPDGGPEWARQHPAPPDHRLHVPAELLISGGKFLSRVAPWPTITADLIGLQLSPYQSLITHDAQSGQQCVPLFAQQDVVFLIASEPDLLSAWYVIGFSRQSDRDVIRIHADAVGIAQVVAAYEKERLAPADVRYEAELLQAETTDGGDNADQCLRNLFGEAVSRQATLVTLSPGPDDGRFCKAQCVIGDHVEDLDHPPNELLPEVISLVRMMANMGRSPAMAALPSGLSARAQRRLPKFRDRRGPQSEETGWLRIWADGIEHTLRVVIHHTPRGEGATFWIARLSTE